MLETAATEAEAVDSEVKSGRSQKQSSIQYLPLSVQYEVRQDEEEWRRARVRCEGCTGWAGIEAIGYATDSTERGGIWRKERVNKEAGEDGGIRRRPWRVGPSACRLLLGSEMDMA
jgi:hypothetical protein